jgi:hypothetical protein
MERYISQALEKVIGALSQVYDLRIGIVLFVELEGRILVFLILQERVATDGCHSIL